MPRRMRPGCKFNGPKSVARFFVSNGSFCRSDNGAGSSTSWSS
jgi:hypothetical protein